MTQFLTTGSVIKTYFVHLSVIALVATNAMIPEKLKRFLNKLGTDVVP